MNTLLTILGLCGLLVALALSVPLQDVNPFAAPPCEPLLCDLPDCLCSAQSPPNSSLNGPNLPQIVYISFDDAVTITNYPFYEELLFNRVNPNGAKISATFFVAHEYTNYSLVHDLWVRGHDIALHSITHKADTVYWSTLNEKGWYDEMIAQKEQVAQFAKIPKESLKGVRAPFMQTSGNPMYKAMVDGGMEWDCSRPTQSQRIPGLWPYTNDYLSTQDCQIAPCPDEAFPGFWTVPMIDLIGDDQFPCAMVDECTPIPMTQKATFDLLRRNFADHYTNENKAPFGIFTHAALLIGDESRPEFAERKAGYFEFFEYLGSLQDVYIVGISQALEWMRTPTSVSELGNFEPWQDIDRNNECLFPRTCRYFNSTWERFMSSCIQCPNVYPWIDNPMGENFLFEEIIQ